MTEISLRFDGRLYSFSPHFPLLCELEEELGSLLLLRERLDNNAWTLSELAVLLHIILQNCGRNVDYMELGEQILKEGAAEYLNFTKGFLDAVFKF